MGRGWSVSPYAVTMDAADTSIIWHLILLIRDADSGKRLLDECLDGLRRVGLKRVIIMVADDNPRGREFWKRCGWEEIPGAIAMGIDL
jgi:hypothetical protein